MRLKSLILLSLLIGISTQVFSAAPPATVLNSVISKHAKFKNVSSVSGVFSGSVAIGSIQLVSIPIFANNSTAKVGGLISGQLYQTGLGTPLIPVY